MNTRTETPAHRITADDPRESIRSMWAAVAESWGENADYTDERHAADTEQLLELTNPLPDERVLELACGAGGVGLAAAQRVLPGGHVIASDVAKQMTVIAAARAERLGVSNMSTRELDLEEIDVADGAFDVVLCRDGLQFTPDPARAAREICRVLRPGGRFAVAVWGPREHNPWLGVVYDAVTAQTGKVVPPPGLPGPFSLADRDDLRGLLTEAGLADVAVNELPVPLRADSFDEWWTRTCALAGPLTSLLASMSTDATGALRDRAQELSRRYETPDGLVFPGSTLLAAGRRA